MKKINVGILGTIGVGKTTLLRHLETALKVVDPSVVVKAEPAVTIPFINEALKKFYTDNGGWSYPLQLCISAAQETFFQELRESDYQYSLFDMPYSSDIYSYSHSKRGNMTIDSHYDLENIGSHFPFDYIILINEDKDTTIERIMARNKDATDGKNTNSQKDVSIEDFAYLDNHIADFKEYQEVWLNRFKSDNPKIKIIRLQHIPELTSPEYDILIDKLVEIVK